MSEQLQNAVATEAIVPTDEQVRLIVDGVRCAVCGEAKKAGAAFCLTDFTALVLYVRRWLTEWKPTESRYCDTFRSAYRHLQLNPARARKIPEATQGWSYRTDDDLHSAGFRFSRHDVCSVPGCNHRIVWWITPNKNWVAVNIEDNQPHRTKCKDPEYFKRKKEEREKLSKERRLQASAKRRKLREQQKRGA